MEKNSLAAILVTQGEYKFYIVAMPSELLRDTCFTITREEDPIEGFQRRLDEQRADEIAKYIDEDKGSIPTAIILSAQENAELKYVSRNKTISFNLEKKSFLIIDGQHRIWGFIKAKNSIRVPVVIYEGLNRVEEAQLFVDINSTQKEVPKELLLDVKRLLQKETDYERRCSEIFEKFFTQKESILKGHLVRAERVSGKISRKVFNNSIAGLMDNVLRELSTVGSFNVINNYLRSIQRILSEIDSDLSSSIVKPVFFQGMMGVSAYVIDKTYLKHNKLTIEAFSDVLQILKTNISKTYLKKPGNSYKKLIERTLDALTKVIIKPGTITEE
ncbi:MAG: DGQHR domain-containing protein [Bacillota bacterium]